MSPDNVIQGEIVHETRSTHWQQDPFLVPFYQCDFKFIKSSKNGVFDRVVIPIPASIRDQYVTYNPNDVVAYFSNPSGSEIITLGFNSPFFKLEKEEHKLAVVRGLLFLASKPSNKKIETVLPNPSSEVKISLPKKLTSLLKKWPNLNQGEILEKLKELTATDFV